jgi:NAD(P)-dependent dehydrogenase (short-subunit alcohol dehydrogenase family)
LKQNCKKQVKSKAWFINGSDFMSLEGKNILITGAALRIGRALALAVAAEGGTIILHYGSSELEAKETQADIQSAGGTAHLLQADLGETSRVPQIVEQALSYGPLFALVNNASIFESQRLGSTSLQDWERHMAINLTAPFLLSQAFAAAHPKGEPGRIVNLLDWRALRPGADHFPYTISKAGLAALTRSLAIALAPDITVNGLALGAILPPSTGGDTHSIIEPVPAGRWAELDEVTQSLLFLLRGPTYITGEILHIDGGRHLV